MILLQLFTRLWSAVIVYDIIINERQIVIRIRFFFFFWAFLPWVPTVKDSWLFRVKIFLSKWRFSTISIHE